MADNEEKKPEDVQYLSPRDVRSLEDQDTPTIWSYIVPHLVGWGIALLLLFGLISFARPVWEPMLDFTIGLLTN